MILISKTVDRPPPPKVFDHALVVRHLSARRPGADDFVTGLVLEDLGERLMRVNRAFSKALIMGPHGALLPTHGTSKMGPFEFTRVASVVGAEGVEVVDPEALALPATDYDLVVSVFDLQIVNDVPGFLAQVRAHLRPDGLFLAAFAGGQTLTELRQAFLAADTKVNGGVFARVAPFIQLGDAGGLLQRARFALPVTDVEPHTVRYSSPLALMAEIKELGASNPLVERPRQATTRGLLAAASAVYDAEFADPDGRVRASLEIVWLSGWAPHESQQKPLKPGSATVSLKAILGKGHAKAK